MGGEGGDHPEYCDLIRGWIGRRDDVFSTFFRYGHVGKYIGVHYGALPPLAPPSFSPSAKTREGDALALGQGPFFGRVGMGDNTIAYGQDFSTSVEMTL